MVVDHNDDELDAICKEFPDEFSLAFGSLRDDGLTSSRIINADFLAPFASVSKLVTALSTFVAVEEGSMELLEPIGGADFSIAHLLSHTAGLGEDGSTSDVARYKILPTGTRRVYSNLGYEVIAEQLSKRTDMSFVDYATEGVLGPLGMASARYAPELFIGGGLGGCTGLVGTVDDLVALVGGLWFPSIVSRESLMAIREPYLPLVPGILPGFGAMVHNVWGMGAEVRGDKHPHWTSPDNTSQTFGHFGRAGSFLWIDPVRGAYCVSLSGVEFGPWAIRLWPKLSTYVLGYVQRSPNASATSR